MGRKCKKCIKFDGEFCTLFNGRSIDELNIHGRCGFFEETKKYNNMIYYFKGNKLRGLDLTMELEEIAIKRHHRWVERKIGIPKGAYHNYKDVCTRMKIENEYPCNVNPSAIEGERVNKLYYLTGRTLKRCKLKSFKSLLIQLFGKNIDKQ